MLVVLGHARGCSLGPWTSPPSLPGRQRRRPLQDLVRGLAPFSALRTSTRIRSPVRESLPGPLLPSPVSEVRSGGLQGVRAAAGRKAPWGPGANLQKVVVIFPGSKPQDPKPSKTGRKERPGSSTPSSQRSAEGTPAASTPFCFRRAKRRPDQEVLPEVQFLS